MGKSQLTIKSFRSIIELWLPSPESPRRSAFSGLASAIGADAAAVAKWWQRDKIPDVWWSAILDTTRARRAGVTSQMMVEFAAAERLGECA